MVGDLLALHPDAAAEIVIARKGADADNLRQTIGEAANRNSYAVSTNKTSPTFHTRVVPRT